MSVGTPESVERTFCALELSGRAVVAFSGGLDSSILLHALVRNAQIPTAQITSIYIDHAVQTESEDWSAFCSKAAADLGITHSTVRIDTSCPPGHSFEAWAREVRYAALRAQMRDGDTLLTAHHAEDVVETFFLQLFRGAGPHGLAGIGERQIFGPGYLLRPMLALTRADIMAYASRHALQWVEDPSNRDEKYDRNYLRQDLLPQVRSRWPAVNARIAHAVDLQSESARALDAAADMLLPASAIARPWQLKVDVVTALDEALQAYVLRRWIKRAGHKIPDTVHLRELLRVTRSRLQTNACINWKGSRVRRYRDTLYLQWDRNEPELAPSYEWDLHKPLKLPHGELSAAQVYGVGINANMLSGQTLQVRFRRGGERCHPENRAHSQSLKRLLQEWGVPPWKRFGLPLLYCSDEIVAVGDLWVTKAFAAKDNELAYRVSWRESAETNG